MAYPLIGGTAIGTVLTLVFLPALYAIWFRVRPSVPQEQVEIRHDETGEDLPVSRVNSAWTDCEGDRLQAVLSSDRQLFFGVPAAIADATIESVICAHCCCAA